MTPGFSVHITGGGDNEVTHHDTRADAFAHGAQFARDNWNAVHPDNLRGYDEGPDNDELAVEIFREARDGFFIEIIDHATGNYI